MNLCERPKRSIGPVLRRLSAGATSVRRAFRSPAGRFISSA
jgi:hypothetical protein